MVKLLIGINHLTVVSGEEFFAFAYEKSEKNWVFIKNIKCIGSSRKSNNGCIECCAFSTCGNFFGICFDKTIIIYSVINWRKLHIFPAERRASDILFFPKSHRLMVADKSGCASFYSFDEYKMEKIEQYLGHNSMLTKALITSDEKFVITCDRDEKIRVTNYPNVYNIERFCLGHKQFVSWIGFLPTDKRVLISCSGDGIILLWDFITGKKLVCFNCNDMTVSDIKTVIAKIVTCKINAISILAVFEYKCSQIRILSVTGEISTLSINLMTMLNFASIPWDIEFYEYYLLCLMPDKNTPLIIWSAADNNFTEGEFFMSIKKFLTDNLDIVLVDHSKNSDIIPLLFKRDVDNLQEYEKRKKARISRLGKSS